MFQNMVNRTHPNFTKWKKEGESRECSVYNVIQMAAISVAILGFTQIKVTRAQAFRTRKKWHCKIEKKVGLLI